MAQAYRETKAAEIQNYKVDAAVTPVVGADDIAMYRIVKSLAAGTIVYSTNGVDGHAGVTLCGGDIGVNLDVQNTGVAIVESGGVVAVNDAITAAAGGKGVVGTGYIIGFALQATTATDQLFSVQLDAMNV